MRLDSRTRKRVRSRQQNRQRVGPNYLGLKDDVFHFEVLLFAPVKGGNDGGRGGPPGMLKKVP